MELNIDFDQFKKYIQTKENAVTLLGADRKLMFAYRISGDILFDKNKITIPISQHGGASPTYIFKRTKNKNTISVNFKPSKIFNITSIMFGVPTVFIILYLSFVSIPKPPPHIGEAPLILKLIIASFFPFIWLSIYGSQFLQRTTLCERTITNWKKLNL